MTSTEEKWQDWV